MRNHKLKKRITEALIALVIIQLCLFAAFIAFEGTVSTLNDESVRGFCYSVKNRQRYLYDTLTLRWSNIESTTDEIVSDIELFLSENNYTIDDFKQDPNINEKLCIQVFPKINTMLRKSGSTGAFIVLDNHPTSNKDVLGGLYLRDIDPDSKSASDNDLMFTIGCPMMIDSQTLPLDSQWQPFFDFSEVEKGSQNFYYSTVDLFKKSRRFGKTGKISFWSDSITLKDNKYLNGISYSVPLVGKTGDFYGVLGVEISTEYLAKQIPPAELSQRNNAIYAVATSNPQNNELKLIATNGHMTNIYLKKDQPLILKDSNIPSFQTLSNPSDVDLIAYPVKLFSTDSYIDENYNTLEKNWYLIAFNTKQDIFRLSWLLQNSLLVSACFSLFLGITISIFIGKNLTNPLTLLIDQLKSLNPNKKIVLNKTGIDEIDELCNSIEDLSNRVLIAQKRISKVISMTEIPVGYFEIFKDSDEVFCSESFNIIMNWEICGDIFISMTEFEKRIKEIDKYKISENPTIYCFREQKWLKLATSNEGSRTIGTISDITTEIREKKRLIYERDYDVMTGLLNRTAFVQHALNVFVKGDSTLKCSALFMADLDNLKYTNDNFGHDIGDLYIKSFANLLKNFKLTNGIVSRRSGDEFNVFLYGFNSEDEILKLVDNFWEQLDNTIITISDEVKIKVRASGGMAFYPRDSKDFKELLSFADYAMYAAKNDVKGGYEVFNQDDYNANAVVYHGQEELNHLIENRLVRYAFQPIIKTDDGSIYGYEMLMRPILPFFANVSEVIRTAKYQNKMGDIERMTWYCALETFFSERAKSDFPKNAKVFINSIGDQILNPNDISAIMDKYKDELSNVVVEFTEDTRSDTIISEQKTQIIRHRWNGMIAIDDFGSGYNNENTLVDNLPDIIKLDIILVRNIDNDPNRQSLVGNIIRFAKERGILVLAEGIETPQEARILIEMGSDLLQGYYFGRPEFEPSKTQYDLTKL